MPPPEPAGAGRGLARFARALFAFAGRDAAPVIAAILGGALLEGLGLAVLVPLLAVLTGTATGRFGALVNDGFAAVGVSGRFERLALLLAVFVGLIALRAVVLAIRDRRLARLQYAFAEQQRAALLAALGGAGWAMVSGLRHARIMQALEHDFDRVSASAQLMLLSLSALWMLAVQWLLAFWIAPPLALFGAVLMLVGAVVLVPTLNRAWRLGRSLASERLQAADGATQLLGGMKLAMAQGLQGEFIAELVATGRRVTEQRMTFARRYSVTRIVGSTGASIAGAAAILFGVWQGVSVVALVAALAVLTRMIGPATTLQQQAQLLMEYLPGYFSQAALRAELDSEISIAPVRGTAPVPRPVVLSGAGYAHPGRDGHGIGDVTLTIAPGELLGLAGPSGAGKTTLLDMIAGLLPPQAGSIRIGDALLDSATLPEWRAGLAYVAQDPYLFNDTLRANLLFGARATADADIAAALILAGADRLIAELPLGLDTLVGERGSALSGGQRQRIVLARAILRRPRVMILDEATSALDVASERAIYAGLRALDPRPTILVVSHRPETLAACDRIVTIADGRIVDEPALG